MNPPSFHSSSESVEAVTIEGRPVICSRKSERVLATEEGVEHTVATAMVAHKCGCLRASDDEPVYLCQVCFGTTCSKPGHRNFCIACCKSLCQAASCMKIVRTSRDTVGTACLEHAPQIEREFKIRCWLSSVIRCFTVQVAP